MDKRRILAAALTAVMLLGMLPAALAAEPQPTEAADELGIDIPGRVSLIGFDNIRSTDLPRINLTTIDQPKREMAVQAVDMLRDKIENGTQGYVHQILMPSLIKRGTCRALV